MLKQIITLTTEELRYTATRALHQLSGDKHLQKVLVNGSPKTGTTWVLKLMTSTPGYRHAPGYNFQGKLDLYHKMSPGDVVHGHDRYSTELGQILDSEGIKVILTVRDPRDQAVSRMFHIRRDTTHPWHQKIKEMDDDELLMACIEGRAETLPGVAVMLGLTQTWLEAGDKAFCIRYEDLLSDPVGNFSEILRYLGITARAGLIKAIVERNQFQRLSVGRKIWKTARKPGQQDTASHFRKGIVGDWKNYFKEPHIQRFKEIAGQTLIDLGYEQDSSW